MNKQVLEAQEIPAGEVFTFRLGMMPEVLVSPANRHDPAVPALLHRQKGNKGARVRTGNGEENL
jgi:hypothetical protein